ncbi:hypothetical protein [Rhizorhapis sp.]|uniref:hypothetical protein n=1 Tax=Rhizorhapis sp. TaxID=1968842 RepID=UPI002B469123|nr:hypothetical protein [Rhizorhapis sp.]HKR17671.1 hypothetical protein [Rhizorhapis sp.]
MSIEITEADRKRTWPIMRHLYTEKDGAEVFFKRDFFAGEYDSHFIVQAFAKHRIAALQAREEETAWLIERHDYIPGLHYYAEYPNGDHYWTPDHLKAMRFATEADARVIAKDDPLLTVAEHMWVANPQVREDVGEALRLAESLCAQVKIDLAAAHEQICKLQGLDPETHAWPEWSSPANTMRWVDEIILPAIKQHVTHPTPTELPGDALRATFKLAASQIERDVRLSELTDGEIDALVRAVRG